MIKIEKIDVYGFEAAIRGMRNPLNSWEKSDSYWTYIENPHTGNTAPFQYFVGENDLDLMRRLYHAGTEHRKYMRQIFVSMDITAPLYWWKEFDTYKVGTTADSTSTMHTLHKRDLTMDDFSHEHLIGDEDLTCYYSEWITPDVLLSMIVDTLNTARRYFIETNDKRYWYSMIQLLPSSYNQLRTVTMNYENAVNMIRQRSGHKLDEWREFVEILRSLPYLEEITRKEDAGNE